MESPKNYRTLNDDMDLLLHIRSPAFIPSEKMKNYHEKEGITARSENLKIHMEE